jgi:hypothetical protein
MGLNNQATINATNSATPLIIQTSTGTTNSGTLEATAGATLNLNGDTYTNNGTIQAVGTGSVVNLENSVQINGGTLTTSTGGVIQTANAATLNGVTNTGTLVTPNNTTTTLQGTITNNSAMQENSGGNITFLKISGTSVTLQGTGTLTLSDNNANFIQGASTGTEILINKEIIQGPGGNIGNTLLTVTNQGTIDATKSAGSNFLTLQPGSGGLTNTATLEATGGGSLVFNGTSAGGFTNTGGTIKAVGAGSVVTLENGATVTGGTLTTSGGGVIQNGNTMTLSGLSNSGTLVTPNNTTTTLKGTITNSGAMQMNSGGNNTFLEMNGNVTLTGGGTLTLSNNAANFLLGAAGANVLTNVNNTISGSGNMATVRWGSTIKRPLTPPTPRLPSSSRPAREPPIAGRWKPPPEPR